jgi:hypothetical protein
MGKRSQAKGRWIAHGQAVAELVEAMKKPGAVVGRNFGPRAPGAVPGPYELMCMDCDEDFESHDLQAVYEWAKGHLLAFPKHDTVLKRTWDEGDSCYFDEDLPLWETVATWGPSVGLEVVTAEAARKWIDANHWTYKK